MYINKAKEYKLIIKENERGITTCIGIEPENYDGTVLIENVDNVGYHNITDGKYNKFKCQAKKVIIGKGVKSIGEYAFYHNKYIEQLVIENRSHIKIGNGSFNDCSNLKEVAIYTNKQAELGPYSFENCNSLKEFYCSARTLGYYVCSGNKNLTKAKIEAVQLSSYSFNECSSLKELDLNVEDIHRFGETAITKLEINNESEIDACIFFDNSKLKEVRINSNRVTISGLMGNLGTRKNKRKDRLKIYIKGDASFINDYNCKYESVYESVKDAKIDIYMDSKCLGFEQLYKNLHGFYNKIESREDTTDAISLIDTSKNNKEQENRQKRVEGMLGKTYSQFLVEEFERAYNQEYNDNLRIADELKIGSMGIKIDDVPILKNTKTNNLGGGISLSFVESSSENATSDLYEFIKYILYKVFDIVNDIKYLKNKNYVMYKHKYIGGNSQIVWMRDGIVANKQMILCIKDDILDLAVIDNRDKKQVDKNNIIGKSNSNSIEIPDNFNNAKYPFKYINTGDLIDDSFSRLGRQHYENDSLYATITKIMSGCVILNRIKTIKNRLYMIEYVFSMNTEDVLILLVSRSIGHIGFVKCLGVVNRNKIGKSTLNLKLGNTNIKNSKEDSKERGISAQGTYAGKDLYSYINRSNLEDLDTYKVMKEFKNQIYFKEVDNSFVSKLNLSLLARKQVDNKHIAEWYSCSRDKRLIALIDKDTNKWETAICTSTDTDDLGMNWLIRSLDEQLTVDNEKVHLLLELVHGSREIEIKDTENKPIIKFYIGFDAKFKMWLLAKDKGNKCKIYKLLPLVGDNAKLIDLYEYSRTVDSSLNGELELLLDMTKKVIFEEECKERDLLLAGCKDAKQYKKLGSFLKSVIGYVK